MRPRKYKRKRLVIGDHILMLAEPGKRAPVRIDRSVPLDYETYLAEREEREREAARSRLLAAATVSSAAPSQDVAVDSGGEAVAGGDSGGDDDAYVYDGATDDGQETPS